MSAPAPFVPTGDRHRTANAHILIVEDDPALREALCDTLAMAGFSTVAVRDGSAALATLGEERAGRFSLVVSDVQMSPVDGLTLLHSIKQSQPDLPVLLMTAFGTIQQAVEAMRVGAADYLVKPFEAEVLAGKVSHYCRPATAGEPADHSMIGVAPASRELAALAARVAQSDVSVIVSGESGTGKEVLARYIHLRSGRAERAFVAINCAAIPENMLEAMLFGYEKGAFTGAHKACPGKFEQADGGTLLLDEISEMALALQAKLLRVLQEREVERLGGRGPVKLDVRVIATTNRDLREEVAQGRFREDLFYRLNVFPLHITALRERAADIPVLARHLLDRAAAATNRPAPVLSAEAVEKLVRHDWPGNVRELDNALQRAMVLCAASEIDAAALLIEPSAVRATARPATARDAERLDEELRQSEFRLIQDALTACGGSRRAVSERLGVSERTLRYKLARMRDAGIDV